MSHQRKEMGAETEASSGKRLWRVVLKPAMLALLLCFSIHSRPDGAESFSRILRLDTGARVTQTDSEIEKILNRKPQLSSPFKVAVVFSDIYSGGRTREGYSTVRQPRDRILQALENLKGIREVIEIPPTRDNKRQIYSEVAAGVGADAVLIISQRIGQVRYTNQLGWSYAFLVTLAFVPASEAEVVFIARAEMWDVRNDFLYFATESESVKSQTRPNFFISLPDLYREARAGAYVGLMKNIKRKIKTGRGKLGQ